MIRSVFCFVFSMGAGAALVAQTAAEMDTGLPPVPPQPGQIVSPARSPLEQLQFFRKLLSLSPEQRQDELANQPELHRNRLLAKLEEYDSLPEADCEQRLQTAEIYLYLRDLMASPAWLRDSKLAALPQEYRGLIGDRLQQWDQLPGALQKEVLENAWMMQFIVRFESSTADQRRVMLQSFPDQERELLEGRLMHWRSLPWERRQRMYDHFQTFFDMAPEEKKRTLSSLSEQDRQQMQTALRPFENLPRQQRQKSIDSLRRFTSMSGSERDEFLRNAERWQAMSPREREIWRSLVTQMPPPPPGLHALPPPPGVLQPPMGTNSPNPPPMPRGTSP
jgi:hypothetical protein